MIWRMRPPQRAIHTSALLRFQNHYEVLGIKVSATSGEIKNRFFELSKRYHPDRNNDADPEKYQQITAAYTVLSSERERKKFDESLGSAVRRPQGYHSGRTWESNDGASTAHRRRPGTSGYSYNIKHMKQHKSRYNSRLDPLKPQYQSKDVPHFDFAKHAEHQQRYEQYRRAERSRTTASERESGAARQSAATVSMGTPDKKSDPYTAGSSFIVKALGAATAGLGMVYLLLR